MEGVVPVQAKRKHGNGAVVKRRILDVTRTHFFHVFCFPFFLSFQHCVFRPAFFLLLQTNKGEERKRAGSLPHLKSSRIPSKSLRESLFFSFPRCFFLSDKKNSHKTKKMKVGFSLSLSLSLSLPLLSRPRTRRAQNKRVNDSLVHAGQREGVEKRMRRRNKGKG